MAKKNRVLIFCPRDFDHRPHEETIDGISLCIAGPSLDEHFTAFDAVAILAGSFESITEDSTYGAPNGRVRVSYNKSEIDKRAVQANAAIKRGTAVVFLVPYIGSRGTDASDLFRRLIRERRISFAQLDPPRAEYRVRAHEFQEYSEHHGSAEVYFDIPDKVSHEVLANLGHMVLAFHVGNLFFLPCFPPAALGDFFRMAQQALRAVLSYRRNRADLVPGWVDDHSIGAEGALRSEYESARAHAARLEQQLAEYRELKGILTSTGDALVCRVKDVLEERFGFRLKSDDIKIEDLSVLGEDDNPLALIEVKGVNRNFQRSDVGQVDGHRERHELSATIPGVVIINTFARETSLNREPPHPDIIKKALNDNVVLLRTVDLLHAVDLLERGLLSAEAFRTALLSRPGWLRVENDALRWSPEDLPQAHAEQALASAG